jgi:hypothetical protein
LTVHVGDRLQATVVLSCPGVDLAPLRDAASSEARGGTTGFTEELIAVRERIDPGTSRRREEARRRRRKVARLLDAEGRWEEEVEVRLWLDGSASMPTDDDFPVEDPPPADEGLDRLPLFFDGRDAPVALAGGLGGWELLVLQPEGGVATSLGVFPPPDRAPRLEPRASELLEAYLAYWLRRDALFGTVHLEMLRQNDGAPVSEWVESELRSIGALVLSRADVRARRARGTVDRLTAADVADGIRATDQDLLDRESWGDRL